jgi:hypothetical protein
MQRVVSQLAEQEGRLPTSVLEDLLSLGCRYDPIQRSFARVRD